MKWNVSGCSDLMELLALRFCYGNICRGSGRPLLRGRSSRSARTATNSMTATPTTTSLGNHDAKSFV
jgi:hypothetical protein